MELVCVYAAGGIAEIGKQIKLTGGTKPRLPFAVGT